MKEEVKYGVIHEVGEYQDLMPLTEEENERLNRKDDNKNNTNENN